MNANIRRLGAVAAVGAFGLTAACSSTSTTTSSATTAAGASGSSTTAAKTATTEGKGTATTAGKTGTTVVNGQVIDVKLKEWTFEPNASTATSGSPVTFAATNNGEKVHELVLFKTDLAPEALPLDEEGAVDERAAGVELIDEVEDVDPGATKSFTVDTLAPGKYLLVCNVVDQGEKHFEHKMYAPFTVT